MKWFTTVYNARQMSRIGKVISFVYPLKIWATLAIPMPMHYMYCRMLAAKGSLFATSFNGRTTRSGERLFPFLPSQNIAATSETRTLQKHRIIIRGLVFHPSGSCFFFFKDVDGFPALIPRKIATKKVLAEPGACRWRYGTRCFKTQGTSAFEDQNIQRFPRFLCSNGPWMVGKMP